MNKYKFTPDGFIFEANSPLEIVNALRASGMFTAEQDQETYMAEFAERVKVMYDIDLAFYDIHSFVLRLFEHNLLERIE
jgi:hypothetical protein